MIRTDPHRMLALHIRARGLPTPEHEYRFSPERRYRLDIAWPEILLGVEAHGGAYGIGPKCPRCGQSQAARHTRGDGFTRDRAKVNLLIELGWCCLEYTTKQIESGEAINQIERVFRGRTRPGND